MWFQARPLPLIRQSEAADCGHACLAMIAGHAGRPIDLVSLRALAPTSGSGVSVHTLTQIAAEIGLKARAFRLEPANLSQLKLPAILHWDMNHFVVLRSLGRRSAVLHDPARGLVTVPLEKLSQHFTGIAVELAPDGAAAPMLPKAALPLRGLLAGYGEVLVQVAQVLALSLFIELFALLYPLYLQIAVDDVIPRNDVNLLILLAVGFGAVSILNFLTQLARSYLLVYINGVLDLSMTVGMFAHLLRLPHDFFAKRDVGDIMSRFHALEPIRTLLANGAALAVIDGVFVIFNLVVMLLISPPLALIAIAAVALYGLLRAFFYAPLRQRSEETVRAEAGYATHFIESLRSIQAIKLANAETMRESQFIGRIAETVDARSRQQKLAGLFTGLHNVLFTFENIAFVTVAALAAMHGRMSIGVIFAMLAYKGQFVERASKMIETGIDLRLLRLYLDRLSDIALTEVEPAYAKPAVGRAPIRGELAVRNLSYRYARGEPLVLDKVSFTIAAGECVAIVGPSGCGKTTLVKILLALLDPLEGEVLVDGLSLGAYGERGYRSQVATVMQEDTLLTGTILQNICFFDEFPDVGLVTQCAELASIHTDILAMPMGYRTIIGSLGNTLSAGQRQRILLARALYRRPKILVLDEGTANLDVTLERRVNETLRGLPITRIQVAHRPETIAMADRVIDLGALKAAARAGVVLA